MIIPNAIAAGTGIACCCVPPVWLAYRTWTDDIRCPNEATSADRGENPTKQGFSMKKVPSDLDAIVIGSGIGGLTTAALLSKQGKKVLVLEQHDVAGGNLHTFKEKGYEFDTGLHYVGGEIGDKFSNSRRQLDYITDNGVEWEPMDDDYDIAISKNERFGFCGCWTKLKNRLKDSFPMDTIAVDTYFKSVQSAVDLFPVLIVLRMLPEFLFHFFLRILGSKIDILKKTTKEVLESITDNEKLRGVLSYHYGDYGEPPERGAFVMNALIAAHYRGGGFYPVGGPIVIAESIIKVIERWGGKVLVRAPVSSILINEKNRANGVVVKGKTIRAKNIISSVGIPKTFTGLVPKSHRHLAGKIIDMTNDPNIVSNISLMSMFVGMNDTDRSLKLPKSNYWIHPSWDFDRNMAEFRADHNKLPAFFISFSSAKDPTYESRYPGKQVALVIGPAVYDNVERFKDDRVKHRSKEYNEMKEQWKKIFLDCLLDQFPQIEGKIDFVDFGTALTNDYYLGTNRGAVYGLAHTPQRFHQYWLRSKTPISNLYLTGQDVCTCGVVGALIGGYFCAYSMSLRCLLKTIKFML